MNDMVKNFYLKKGALWRNGKEPVRKRDQRLEKKIERKARGERKRKKRERERGREKCLKLKVSISQ